MSKLTNRFILLAAAVVLPACGGATTTSASTDAAPPGATAAATAPATSEQQPLTEEVQPPEPSASMAVVESTAPGNEPDDLLPLEPLEKQGDPAVPTPVDPFVRVPFAVTPTPAPIPVPPFVPFELVADLEAHTPAAGGGTFTAATGCGSLCISDARISTVGGASTSYDLAVVLDVTGEVDVEAFLSQAPIERNADGRHIPPFSQPTASGQPSADWGPGVSHWETSFALDPATTYHLLVRARDAQGLSAVAGTFTTAEAMGPDVLATPSPCLDGCLEDIRVQASDDGRSLSITVSSTVDADVEFQWSQGPVVQGDDGPTLDDPSTRSAVLGADTPSTLDIRGLTPYRSYSFIVIATDSFGSSDRWIATVATPSPVIIAGIDRVHISGDGDDGSNNPGEIRFDFGMRGEYWGHRGEEKLSSNSTVQLGRESASALEVDAFGRYPWVGVFAGERDGVKKVLGNCFVQASEDWRPGSASSSCGNAVTRWSEAYVPDMTLTEIEALTTCETYDVNHTGADRCAWASTSPNSSDQVSFEYVIWFDLDPLG